MSLLKKYFFWEKNREVDIFVSIAILQTTSYFLQKSYGSKVAKELLLELLLFVNIVEADENAVQLALNSSITDIEDAVHFYTAVKHKLNYIISSNLDFQKLTNKNLQVISAKKFLDLYR